MLALNFRPEFTWVDFRKKKPQSFSCVDAEPLCVKSIRCTPKVAAEVGPKKALRDYNFWSKTKTESAKIIKKRAELNRAILIDTLARCSKIKPSQKFATISLTQRTRPKSAKISALSVAFMKYRSLNSPKKSTAVPKESLCQAKKAESLIVRGTSSTILCFKNLKPATSTVTTTTASSKKVNFRDLAIKRQNLLKIAESQKRCETAYKTTRHAPPMLMVSQVPALTVSNGPFSHSKRAVTTEGGNRDTSFTESTSKSPYWNTEADGFESEYTNFAKRSTFRPITSGAIVVKTREGKPLKGKDGYSYA